MAETITTTATEALVARFSHTLATASIAIGWTYGRTSDTPKDTTMTACPERAPMTETPFELYYVGDESVDYMQLAYNGLHGKFAGEFNRSEVEHLKQAIATWEARWHA